MMKINQIRALVACESAGSIRGAARSLGISQAAVTRALRELEAEQQLPLFVRAHSGLTYTESGQVLLNHAKLILNQLHRADEEIMHLKGTMEGRLCIGVTPWIISTFLPEAILKFRAKMPSIKLELFESLLSTSQSLLRSGHMDFMLGYYLQQSEKSREFTNEPLLLYDTSVLVRPGHPCQDCRNIKDLVEQEWVLNYSGDDNSALIEHLFTRFGASIDPGRIICAHSSSMIQALVEHAGMCTWSPTALSYLPEFKDRVHVVPIVEEIEPCELSIISPQSTPLSSAAICFIDSIKEVCRRYSRLNDAKKQRLFGKFSLIE